LMQNATTLHVRLPDESWNKTCEVVVGALAAERHGHWFDYLMMRDEGEERAVPANTRYQIECLASYVAYLADGMPNVSGVETRPRSHV
jgi:hypothetical protein